MGYRLIIADDEPKVIQLIRQLGHWKELAIEIVDECHNGREAYESITAHKPDFVLSDVKMPVYDGIELIRKVREADLDPLFILLSGYRHFEYARSAVQLNVMDYLLKPIDEKQLNETLKRVCLQIDRLRAQKEERTMLSDMKEEKDRQEMERFWELVTWPQLPSGETCLTSEEACNTRFHTEFKGGCYQVLCIFSNLSAVLGKRDSLSSIKVDSHIRESFPVKVLIHYHTTYMGYVIILNFPKECRALVREAVSVLYCNIRDLCEVYGEFRLNIGSSLIKSSVSEIRRAFLEAHDAEWGRLIIARNGVLEYGQIASLPRFCMDDLIQKEELDTLKDCIKYLRREELGDLFEKIYQRAGKFNNFHPDDMMTAFFQIRDHVLHFFEEAEKRKHFLENYYYAYLNGRSFQHVMRGVYLVFEKGIDEEKRKLKEKMGRPIQVAVRYIRENYAKQISLEDAAQASNVSGNYLSRLFKGEIGVGFSEFLTQVRLEESEKLLTQTNLSIREIAAMVGYLDEKYYSRLFKKTTGIKPTDYRRVYS